MTQPYKLELIDDVEGNKVSIYRQNGFVDLCAARTSTAPAR
jgi:threonyl-tRNA synthetase